MPYTRREFVRTVFAASQAGVVGALMTERSVATDLPADALNFGILGDWGRYGRPDQAAVAQQLGIACDKVKASFLMVVGDNFYEDGVASLQDEHWVKSFENVYTAPSLQVPWYVILGNHDYHGNSEAQLEYAKTHPRWIMPARYYTQVHTIDAKTRMECFYIDTSPMIGDYKDMPIMQSVHAQDVPAQLAWLDAALAKSTAAWKIVVGHHPIYSAGHGHGTQQDLVRLILPLLEKHKVPVYFAGHDHDLQHLKSDHLHMIVSGGGSEHRPSGHIAQTEFGLGISGFAMASVRADEMQVRLIDDKGRLLHTASVPRTV